MTENLVEKFVKTLMRGGTLYLCEKCGLLTSYIIRREITELEEHDSFTGEKMYCDVASVEEETICPNCYREVLELESLEDTIEELSNFIEENPGRKLEKQILEKLRETVKVVEQPV